MPLDQHAPEMARFIRSLEEKIETCRNGLERVGKTHEETTFLRGRIKAYRDVIAQLTNQEDEE